ncbi:MAG: Rrf2 family transcriptional regulator [Ruminococcaceae bacterium]|nr:Rrf2 family transcriptional regulator [Oscillospiraceae bacterium]
MVSAKGRYALRIFIDLAQNQGDGYVALSEVSKRQDVSLKYLETIVATLVRGGLLRSQRGMSGGYRLSRDAKEISIYDIFNLTEGSLSPVACINCGENFCNRSEICYTKEMWTNVDNLLNNYFKSVSVQDLLEKNVKIVEVL